jgi:hypothetical protein
LGELSWKKFRQQGSDFVRPTLPVAASRHLNATTLNFEAAGHDRDRIVMGHVDRASPLLLKFSRVARPTGRLLALYR